jgi:hypothetical protein
MGRKLRNCPIDLLCFRETEISKYEEYFLYIFIRLSVGLFLGI